MPSFHRAQLAGIPLLNMFNNAKLSLTTIPHSFMGLPVELLCDILAHLDVSNLLACTLVCRRLRKIIGQSSHLEFMIALEKWRMVSVDDGPGIPYSVRLNSLRERESAWVNLAWKNKYTVNLPNTGSIYEFIGAVYGNGGEQDADKTTLLSFYDLPGSNSPGPCQSSVPRAWVHSVADLTVVDFTMDPSRDLLVIVVIAPAESKFLYDIHLRTLSSNQPHPGASIHILPSVPKPEDMVGTPDNAGSVRIQISGDLIAFLIKECVDTVTGHLEIWNWEAGPKFSCAITRNEGIDDFAFLSQEMFLLARPSGRFEIYTFQNPKISPQPPILQAIYAFPLLSPGYSYWCISVSSNPAAGHISTTEKDRVAPSANSTDRTFAPNPGERILSCSIYLFRRGEDGEHRIHSFVFFLNVKMFVDLASRRITPTIPPPMNLARMASSKILLGTQTVTPSAPSPHGSPSRPPLVVPDDDDEEEGHQTLPPRPPSPPSGPTYVPPFYASTESSLFTQAGHHYVPWESWGPRSTRFFTESLSADWQHAVYGTRTLDTIDVLPERGSGSGQTVITAAAVADNGNPMGDEPRYLRLREYNSRNFDAYATPALGREQWRSRRIVREPTTVTSPVFLQPITSHLPYAELVSKEIFQASDAMLDNGRVLLLRRAADGRLKQIDVLTM